MNPNYKHYALYLSIIFLTNKVDSNQNSKLLRKQYFYSIYSINQVHRMINDQREQIQKKVLLKSTSGPANTALAQNSTRFRSF